MYLSKILFESKYKVSDQIFYSLLKAWRNNGQIIDATLNLYKKINVVTLYNQYFIYAVIPQRDSLNDCYSNEYVRNQLNNIKNENITLSISIEGENEYICFIDNINEVQAITLHYDETIASPLRKLENFLSIPLYLLPFSGSDKNYQNIIEWCNLSESLYKMETWSNGAVRQLLDINSRYNKLGREICKSLEKVLNLPVYYYLYRRSYSTSISKELNRILLSTENIIIDNENFQLINHAERIITQITPQILKKLGNERNKVISS